MSPARAEALVKLTMRGLALSFAVVGILFIATPDGVLHRIDQLGDALGSFSHAPRTEEKLWLALGFAYMTVITGLAFVVSLDPVRYRPMLLVLAAGKAASSLAAGSVLPRRGRLHLPAQLPGRRRARTARARVLVADGENRGPNPRLKERPGPEGAGARDARRRGRGAPSARRRAPGRGG